VKGFVIGIIATAVAFALMAWFLPQVSIEPEDDIAGLLGLSLVFGLVNGVIKPIVKLLTLPVTLMTLGLFGLVINAGLLLLVASITQSVFNFTLSIGGWPGGDFSLEVIVAALLASIVLTIIQTAIGLLVKDAR
jgi:putative membrane protein